MVNQFVRDATIANCGSIQLREELWRRAVRKDGEEKNGADKNLLFPRARIEAVLGLEEMTRVLDCQCTLCTRQGQEPMFTANLPHQILQDWSKRRSFAVLIYMGATFAARTFFRHGFGTNSFNIESAMCILPLPANINTPNFFKSFREVFESTKLLFEPVFFQKRGVWSTFGAEENLPFLFEKALKSSPQSPSRNMYSFWLHAEFCDGLPSINIPEDQPIDPEADYPDMKLARKELTGDIAAFEAERTVLEFITGEHHPHLIKLLFWYQRGPMFNLVFRYYPANLQQVFEDGWFPERQPAIPERFKTSKLRHWLWEQLLKVIEGLGCVHTPGPAEDRLPGIPNVIGGHFDIKPANILIDQNGQLVLADFGLAQIKNISQGGASTFTGPVGTLSHQPPWWSDNGDAHWRRSYDVWSMACVMMDTIQFVLRGSGGVKAFIAERENEETPNMKSSAFWKYGPGGGSLPVLKKCVQDSLTRLKAENDRYLTMVANLLQQMFSIDPKARLTIAQCVKKLSMDHLADQWPRKDEDEISIGGNHTQKPLQQLNVSLEYGSANETYGPIKCSLHVFREYSNKYSAIERDTDPVQASGDLLGDVIRVVLDFVEEDGVRHMLSERGFRQKEVLKPLIYFEDSQRGPGLRACAFASMHRKLTLNFPKSRDYYHFQAALTHQRVYEASHALITRCWLKDVKKFNSRPQKYSAGRIEIWKQLGDKGYHDEFIASAEMAHKNSIPSEEASHISGERYSVPPSPGRPPVSYTLPMHSQVAKHSPKVALSPRRLVIYLKGEKRIISANLNTYPIVKSRCDYIEDSRDELCLSFIPNSTQGYKSFPIGIISGSEHGQEQGHGKMPSLKVNVPGIPLDPNLLIEKEDTKWLEVEFATPEGKRSFVNVYNDLFQNFPDRKIRF